MSDGLLTTDGSSSKHQLALRDHAMLQISACVGMRGDNVRPILLSDLMIRDIPLINIGYGITAKVSRTPLVFGVGANYIAGACDH